MAETMFSRRTNWQLTSNPLTLAIEEARASGQKILDLTVSNPTEAGIRPEPEAVLAALANPKAMGYDPQPRGLFEARQAVCNYYRESHEVDIDPKRLLLTTSTSEAYSYVFRLLCNPGDEILVPKPSYPLFEFLADLADVKLIPYPLLYDHGWQIDFPSLEKAATTRAGQLFWFTPTIRPAPMSPPAKWGRSTPCAANIISRSSSTKFFSTTRLIACGAAASSRTKTR